jgi:ectoine hydroxylase-related dioxygenase (phytanoyl-CoA dioxygenase family)
MNKSCSGFKILSSYIGQETCLRYYHICQAIAGGRADVAHYEAPEHLIQEIARDPMICAAVSLSLSTVGGYGLIHSAIHSNPAGAKPLDWHSDDCKPWFMGRPCDAPPAVRIWFFPQAVPVDRGPIELIPTGKSSTDSVLATCQAGDFIAVEDMGLIHRATANRSGLDRFMIRLEFTRFTNL